MKKTIAIFIILFSVSLLYAQRNAKFDPLIFQGQLVNCKANLLTVSYYNPGGELREDSFNLDTNGRFYLKTKKLYQPQIVSIKGHDFAIHDVLVAPGYNLTISADASTDWSLRTTMKISGEGAAANRYKILLDSILAHRKDTTKWYNADATHLAEYLEKENRLRDSVAHVVFDNPAMNQKYFKEFSSIVKLHNAFKKLSLLVSYVRIKNFDDENSVKLVRENFNTYILDHLSNEEYLKSNVFRDLIANGYLEYLMIAEFKRSESLQKLKYYNLKKAEQAYTGKVREFVLYRLISSHIETAYSLENLEEYYREFGPYFAYFKSGFYKNSIRSAFEEKEADLTGLLVGKPAPAFTLESSEGTNISLEQFRGKVVYLDLWASWCGPCRREIPSFKKLYQQYGKDPRVVFISIAINDEFDDWKKALQEDKPTWIQLVDKNDLVWKAYVAARIPRYVLIDKNGKIVDGDAPRPSNTSKLVQLIEQELSKESKN